MDLERVEELRELVKDGVSFFDRTRRSFLGRLEEMVDQLRVALEQSDVAAAGAAAHALKGSARNLGLERLGLIADQIEHRANAGTLAGVGDLEARLQEAVVEASAALTRLD